MKELTQSQKALMIQNGMNPLKESHVKAFLAGKKINAAVENQERIKAILGDKVNVSIGSATYRDVDAASMVGTQYSAPDTSFAQQEVFDPRKQIQAEMQNYDISAGTPSLGGIQSLRDEPVQQRQQSNLTAQKLQENAASLATNYYNAFVTSLKNPGTQANIDVFQALEKLLKYEASIKKSHGDKARSILQESVNNVTRQMYQNLKG